jgi:hypothetical protein
MNKKIISFSLLAVVMVFIYLLVNGKNKKAKDAILTSGGGVDYTPPKGGIIPNAPSLSTPPILPDYGNIPNANATVINTALTALTVKLIQAASNIKIDGKNGQNTQAAISVLHGKGVNTTNEAEIIKNLLQTEYPKAFILKKGSKNNFVKALQLFLGVPADGNFGAGTEAALYKATGQRVCNYETLLNLYAKVSGNNINLTATPRIWEQQPWNTQTQTQAPSPLKPPSLATQPYYQFGQQSSLFTNPFKL